MGKSTEWERRTTNENHDGEGEIAPDINSTKNMLFASDVLDFADKGLTSSRRLINDFYAENVDDPGKKTNNPVGSNYPQAKDSCLSVNENIDHSFQESEGISAMQIRSLSFHSEDLSELTSHVNSPTRPNISPSNSFVEDDDVQASLSLPVRFGVEQGPQDKNMTDALKILDGLPKKRQYSKGELDNYKDGLEQIFSIDREEEKLFRGINLKKKTLKILNPSDKSIKNDVLPQSFGRPNKDTVKILDGTNVQLKAAPINLSRNDDIDSRSKNISPYSDFRHEDAHYRLSDDKNQPTIDTKNFDDDALQKWVKQMVVFTNHDIEDVWKSHGSDDSNNEDFHTETTSSYFICHEINRGNWSWCSAWSPDGNYLAVGTENHGLAVIDTMTTSVWKVIQDSKLKNSGFRNHSTCTIRNIAWGDEFIAVGGAGDSVSIIEPSGSFPIVHIINGTGFIDQMSWRKNSSILAIASRDNQCLIVAIKSYSNSSNQLVDKELNQTVMSQILLTIETADWVTAVSFSPDGSFLAMGNRRGKLFIYYYIERGDEVSMKLIKKIQFNGTILDIAWSATGEKVFIGGEDLKCTIISAPNWKILNRIKRDRWVQFVSPTSSGTHVILGGGSPKCAMHCETDNFELLKLIQPFNGLVLSAKWHPGDYFLAMTGQDYKICVLETNVTRYVPNKCICSGYIVTAMDVSVCGNILIVGKSNGVVTFFDISHSGFAKLYELVFAGNDVRAIRTSPDGNYVAIGGGSMLMLVKIHKEISQSQDRIKISSRFSIQQIKRDIDNINSVSFSPCSTIITISACTTHLFRITNTELQFVQEIDLGSEAVLATEWSPDGSLLAMTGMNQELTIRCHGNDEQWQIILKLECEYGGVALAWASATLSSDLYYLAYGEENIVHILEIRTKELSWENVLEIPRSSKINALSWNKNGLLAIGFSDGNVTIVDLAYLQSGRPVIEMDYTWQRQGITCLTEIRNYKSNVSMVAVQWIPHENNNLNLLALCSNNCFEMMDLSPRHILPHSNNNFKYLF